MAAALSLLCQYGYAAGDKTEYGPAVKVLESGRKTKMLEGSTLKIARPILKKTPISVIMDDIEMMMICPLENKDRDELTAKAENILGKYMLVREINDELSNIFIYIVCVLLHSLINKKGYYYGRNNDWLWCVLWLLGFNFNYNPR